MIHTGISTLTTAITFAICCCFIVYGWGLTDFNPLHDIKYILSLAYTRGFKWHFFTLPFTYSAFSPKHTHLHPLTQENKSKDIFDNNKPFSSLNCTFSHPASEYFLEMSTISSQTENIDAYLSIYAYNKSMQLISIKAISFGYAN